MQIGNGHLMGKQGSKCHECGSTNTYEDGHTGDEVCKSCGLVIGKVIDQGEEWRSFGGDEPGEDRSRVGAAS